MDVHFGGGGGGGDGGFVMLKAAKVVKVGLKETKVGKNCLPNCQSGAYGKGYPRR
jgi:hypothetical protein